MWTVVVALCMLIEFLKVPTLTAAPSKTTDAGHVALSRRNRRAATSDSSRLWPNGRVYYSIDEHALSDATILHIRYAIKHWEDRTCLQFIKRVDEPDYALFTAEDCGCCSVVGRIGGQQNVSLSSRCSSPGIAIHEIGHVIGFWHEHTRPDRDSWIDVRLDNVKPTKKVNFAMRPASEINSLNRPYDYDSIMHYGRTIFSHNGKETLVPKFLTDIGQKKGLSKEDVIQTLLLYNCPSPRCDEELTGSSGVIHSPFYPRMYLRNTDCEWTVKADEDKFVELTFKGFYLQSSENCTADFLEVRRGSSSGAFIGRWCGHGLPRRIINRGPLWLRFHTDQSHEAMGLLIDYKITADEGIPIPRPYSDCVRMTTERNGTFDSPLVPTGETEHVKCELIIMPIPERPSNVYIKMKPTSASHLLRGPDCLGHLYRMVTEPRGVMSASNHSDDLSPKHFEKVSYSCAEGMEEISVPNSTVFFRWSSMKHAPVNLEYVIDYDECQRVPSVCHENQICTNTMMSYECACNSGYTKSIEGACVPKVPEVTDQCGGITTAKSGKIRSSNEPVENCMWFINATGHRITLKFHKFRIPASPGCRDHYLEIRSSNRHQEPKGRYCGRNLPPDVTVTNGLVLRLHTNYHLLSPTSHPRVPQFTATYEAYRKDESCHHALKATRGQVRTITSPGYPSPYPNGYTCSWRVTAPQHHRVAISFVDFSMEDTRNCMYDSLEFVNGKGLRDVSEVLGRFCGYDTPHNTTIISSGRHLMIRFTTDKDINSRGFKLTYAIV